MFKKKIAQDWMCKVEVFKVDCRFTTL